MKTKYKERNKIRQKPDVSLKINQSWTIARLVGIILIMVIIILLGSKVNIEQLRVHIEQLGIWASVAIFCLRFISVIFPAIPGTVYSVLAGSLLGFIPGAITICLADFCSCSLGFSLSRLYGHKVVKAMVGERFLYRIDNLSQQHLENNFFLMTGCLMTGFFDFVCYAVGLTKTSWKKFMPALIISIFLSNLPIVAVGSGIFEGGKLMLGFAILGIFALAIVTHLVKRKQIRT